MRSLTLVGTWSFVRVSCTSLCGIEPYAFARSSHSTDRLPLFSLASLMSYVTTPVCSKHPGIPAIPPFWTDVSINLLFERKVHSRLETALKKILASTHNSEMMRNWSIFLEFSSFGIQTPSATLHCSGILPLLQMIRRIFHRRSRSLGQFLYTLYEVPLGPDAELARTFPTTSRTSFNCSSAMLNCTLGPVGSIRVLHSPNSCSLAGSLYVSFRWWSISSLEQTSWPLRFWTSSSLVNLKGLEQNAARFWALSRRRLRCHSAQRRILIFFRRMHISCARPVRSSSPACLYCCLRVFISCLMLWILSSRWFFRWDPLEPPSFTSSPNRSAAMLTRIVVMACIFLSTSPLIVASRIWSTSMSNWFHSEVMFAAGHLIRLLSDLMLEGVICNTWRFRALWGDSGPGSSCVSPGWEPVRCVGPVPTRHFIFPWWIFRPRSFLQILPHVHCLLVFVCPLPWSNIVESIRLGCSSSPPLGHPWGYFFLRFIVAFMGVPLTEDTDWVASPYCPGCRLSKLSLSLQSSPNFLWLPTSLSWSSLIESD